MGVKGLKTFVHDNPHLLQKIKIHHTKVVIDGDNLLYNFYSTNVQFGGDYDRIAADIRSYFQRFKDCHIEPVIVFDGTEEPDGRKFKTKLERAKERLKNIRQLLQGHQSRVYPLLIRETFKAVICELGLTHYTSEFEADKQIAALANELCCPVMSDDSDFYIYQVERGVIPLDSIDRREQSARSNCIACRIYYQETFLRNQGITREMVALFASLMGNDYISRTDLEPFYEAIEMGDCDKRYLGPNLVRWLKNINTEPSPLERVLLSYKSDKRREDMKAKLQLSLDEYQKPVRYPLQFQYQSEVKKSPQKSERDTFGRIGGKLFPIWLLDNFRQGHLLIANMISMAVTHRTILTPQIENQEALSSYYCSRKLRQIAYSLLILADDENACPCVTEYDREGSRIQNVEVPILDKSNEVLGGVKLVNVPDLSSEERLKKLLHFLSVSEDVYNQIEGLVGKNNCLPYLAMIYWVENASTTLEDVHLNSLLLCFMKWSMRVPKEQEVDIPDEDTLHVFAQFQSCLRATFILNQLLMFPLKCPNPASFINGTFLHSMCGILKNNPDSYVQEFLGKKSPIFVKFSKVSQCIAQPRSKEPAACASL